MEAKQKVVIKSYLTFKIGDELFAANVGKVLSILELTRITRIPRTPDYIRGVINLRGTVLPIIDLRIKFGLPQTEFTSNTCILVLEIEMDDMVINIGALVDSVQEVLEIENEQLLPAPGFGGSFKTDFIKAMYKAEDTFIMILNLDHIFTSDELTVMNFSEMHLDLNKEDADDVAKG
jgi:purine-binding chemotaxis protein CheW